MIPTSLTNLVSPITYAPFMLARLIGITRTEPAIASPIRPAPPALSEKLRMRPKPGGAHRILYRFQIDRRNAAWDGKPSDLSVGRQNLTRPEAAINPSIG